MTGVMRKSNEGQARGPAPTILRFGECTIPGSITDVRYGYVGMIIRAQVRMR